MQFQKKRVTESYFSSLHECLPVAGLILLVGCQTYVLVSPMLRYAALALGMGLISLYCLMNNRWILGQKNLVLGWLGLVLMGEFFDLINSANPFSAKAAAFRLICYALVLGGMAIGIRHRAGVLRLQLSWPQRHLMLVCWAMVAAGAIIYIRDISSILAFVSAGRFTGSGDLHPVGIAYGYACCAAIAMALLLWDRSRLFRLANILMLVLLLRAILSTGSRGAVLALVVTTGIMAVCMLRKADQKERVLFLILGAVVGVAGIGVLLSSDFAREQMQFYSNRFMALDTGRDMAANERIITWKYYWDMIDTWALFGLRGYAGAYPHNIFYEFWLRFGLPGLGFSFAVLTAFFYAIKMLWQGGASPILWAVIGVFMFSFINAQFNLALEFNRALWLGLGCIFACRFYFPGLRTDPDSRNLPKK